MILYCIILYDMILYYIIWYYIILYYMIWYYTVLYYMIWYYIILYDIILYYIILNHIILYYIIWLLYYIIWYDIILYYMIWYYIVLYYMIWYYIILYDIILYYIIWYDIILYYIIWYDMILYYIILMIIHVLMISISICIPGCGSWPRKVDAWKHNWTNFGGFIPSPDFRSAWPSGWIDATHPGRYHQATKSMSCQVTCGSCRSTSLKRDPWVSYQPASQMQAKRRTWKRRRSCRFRCETSGSFKDPVKTKFRLVMV